MKKIILFLSFAVLCSCSVQKRKYQKGFYVNWKSHKQQAIGNQQTANAKQKSEEKLPVADCQLLTATADKKADILNLAPKKHLFDENDSCDVILFKDGKEIKAKVFEIAADEIKYKRCDMLSGPLYVAKKSEIFMVKYANGMSEVFKSETPSTASNKNSNTNYQPNAYNEPKVSALAIMSLIFGILGVWPLTFLGSIVAVICGNAALKQMQKSPNQYKGEGMARAGIILGWVMLGLFLLVLLLFIILLLAFI